MFKERNSGGTIPPRATFSQGMQGKKEPGQFLRRIGKRGERPQNTSSEVKGATKKDSPNKFTTCLRKGGEDAQNSLSKKEGGRGIQDEAFFIALGQKPAPV